MVFCHADHIAGSIGGEPQRDFNFSVEIPAIQYATQLYCQTVTMPEYNGETREIRKNNLFEKLVTRVTFSDITITVAEMVDENLFLDFENWWRRVFDPDQGQIFAPDNYKETGRLLWLGPDGGDERGWVLEGVFPTSVNGGQGDYAGGGIVPLQMVLSVDLVKYE